MPYDVVNSSEAAELAQGSPWSFLHVVRPEIGLPAGTDLYDDVVYEAARANLERWIAEVPYSAGDPSMLVYRLVQDGRAQIGVVGGCSIDEYDAGVIAIHERTRQAKEDDRTRHVVTMRCQAEPIFLAYRATVAIDRLVADICAGTPEVDFVAADGVRHSLWTVPDPDAITSAFEAVPRLYVADGHHRTKSASRARATLAAGDPDHDGTEPYNSVLSVVFPDSQLEILPYNRVVTDLGGRTPADVADELVRRFGAVRTDEPSPDRRHCFCFYADGSWYRLRIDPDGDAGPIDGLDVSLLQDTILAPLFGVSDPRTDTRLDFVGGSRGTGELERRADRVGGVAFSLFATSLEELFTVADAGEIMPPKSTWFEPKLRSGLVLHRI